MEKICEVHGVVKTTGTRYSTCTKCNSDRVRRRRHRLKEMAIAYKGGECCKCGYSKCKGAMEFHHRDPTQKDFGLGMGGHTRSWARMKVELEKCDMLCSNCHREEHERLHLEEQ
jgi:5-methylcytosine-specific restriction endonuclease McrA